MTAPGTPRPGAGEAVTVCVDGQTYQRTRYESGAGLWVHVSAIGYFRVAASLSAALDQLAAIATLLPPDATPGRTLAERVAGVVAERDRYGDALRELLRLYGDEKHAAVEGQEFDRAAGLRHMERELQAVLGLETGGPAAYMLREEPGAGGATPAPTPGAAGA